MHFIVLWICIKSITSNREYNSYHDIVVSYKYLNLLETSLENENTRYDLVENTVILIYLHNYLAHRKTKLNSIMVS